MSTNSFIPLAEVQSLEAHNFGANPDIAVRSALIDVARYGVAQICNIGPVLTDNDLQAMSLWAEHYKKDDDGLINGISDEINSRADIFGATIKELFGTLAAKTTAGLSVEQRSLRARGVLDRPDWHKDGSDFQIVAPGIRAIFPIMLSDDKSKSSLLVSRNLTDIHTKQEALATMHNRLPISTHLSVPYSPRSALLMAEGTGGMKVICEGQDEIYGVESPLHAGWCDRDNLATRHMLVVDGVLRKSKRNNSAFRISISPEQLRLVA